VNFRFSEESWCVVDHWKGRGSCSGKSVQIRAWEEDRCCLESWLIDSQYRVRETKVDVGIQVDQWRNVQNWEEACCLGRE